MLTTSTGSCFGQVVGKWSADAKRCCVAGRWLNRWAVGNWMSADVLRQTRTPFFPSVTTMQWMWARRGWHRRKHSSIISSRFLSFGSLSPVRLEPASHLWSGCLVTARFIVLSSLRLGDVYVMLCQASDKNGFFAFNMQVGSNHTRHRAQKNLQLLRR